MPAGTRGAGRRRALGVGLCPEGLVWAATSRSAPDIQLSAFPLKIIICFPDRGGQNDPDEVPANYSISGGVAWWRLEPAWAQGE